MGTRIEGFRVPPGRFDGVIGGPPCQAHSLLRHLNPLSGWESGDLIPEFCRVVGEAQPIWFVMENVPEAPDPHVHGFTVARVVLQNLDLGEWSGQEQRRRRCFWFGCRRPAKPFVVPRAVLPTSSAAAATAVLAGHGAALGQRTAKRRLASGALGGGGMVARDLPTAARLQGLPPDFLLRLPFREKAARQLLGNGVPLPMGRAVAQAVRRSIAP
jgi:DNA (cytosine-5)-methyltransferase 1